MTQKTALIDADYLCYVIPHQLKSISENFPDYRQQVDRNIEFIIDQTGASHYLVFLTEGKSFRRRVAQIKTYKGTRDSRKPLFYAELKNYMYDHHQAINVPDLEADDLVIMYHKRLKQENHPNVIVSPDKDLRQVPAVFYNPQKDEFEKLTALQASYNFWFSMLVGDATDNIQGLYGTGKKTAAQLLDGAEVSYRQVVLDKYTAKMGVKEGINAFTENFNLLYILRTSSEYSCEAEPILFTKNAEKEEDPI